MSLSINAMGVVGASEMIGVPESHCPICSESHHRRYMCSDTQHQVQTWLLAPEAASQATWRRLSVGLKLIDPLHSV